MRPTSASAWPGIRETASNADAKPNDDASAHALEEKLLDRVSFERGSMEFYDESVQKPPYLVFISDAKATGEHLHLPKLDERTNLAISGSIKGPTHTGDLRRLDGDRDERLADGRDAAQRRRVDARSVPAEESGGDRWHARHDRRRPCRTIASTRRDR